MTNDNAEYWKKRIKEKLESNFKQSYSNIEELERNARHAGLYMGDISEAIGDVVQAYKKLDKTFNEAGKR